MVTNLPPFELSVWLQTYPHLICLCGYKLAANRRSSEIQGTAFGKCLQAWPPAGVAQSSHAFVGGTVSTWAR